MPRLKILAAPIAYNEKEKIVSVVRRFETVKGIDELLVLNDASTDGTREAVEALGVKVLSHERRRGVGAGIRTVIRYAERNGFDVAVILAGNDKDRPAEYTRLVRPILEEGFDLVQGSRYLPGGDYGNMPFYRQLATRYVHPWLFSLTSGQRMTDTTNGFRAIRVSVFKDPKIAIDQAWLDQYELEPYILYQLIKLGYKVKEVPVTKIYPPKALGYTKMRPITGWWSILKPIFLLSLGLKK